MAAVGLSLAYSPDSMGDKAIMDVVCSTDLFSWSEWCSINRVRKFKGLHIIADIVLCDGCTVDPWLLTRDPLDSTPVLLVEQITCDGFSLFCQAITILTSLTFCLSTALGSYVSKPHCQDLWLLSDYLTALYKIINDLSYTCCSLLASACATHFSMSFSNPQLCVGQYSCNIGASMVVGDDPWLLLFTLVHKFIGLPCIGAHSLNAFGLFQTNLYGRLL